MILDYLRLRRMGIKHKVAATMTNLDVLTRNLRAAAPILATLVGLLWVHGWMLERDIEDAQTHQSSNAAKEGVSCSVR